MYYLNSRYYDPKVGRFISIDNINILDDTDQDFNGLNLYDYCMNNPLMWLLTTPDFGGIVGSRGVENEKHEIYNSDFISPGNGNISILPVIDHIFDQIDNFFSGIAGGINGFLDTFKSAPFLKYSKRLGKFSKIMMGISIVLDLGISAYSNFNNNNLSKGQQWGSFFADVGYIGVKTTLAYIGGALLGKLAVVAGTAAGALAITTLGLGFMGATVIAMGAAVIVGVAGAVIIILLSERSDKIWSCFKNKWFK
jgi:hypothetical protein